MRSKLLNITIANLGCIGNEGLTVSLDNILCLVGDNNSGKSTILKAIFGLAPIDSGQVFWEGQQFKPVSHEVVERGISFVPQGRRVFHHLTVLENLEIGGFNIKSATDRKERIKNVLE